MNTSKLTAAAEELVKAACDQVGSNNSAFGKATVEGLATLKESLDVKIDTLTQHVVTLNQNILLQTNAQKLAAKNASLDWAISNSALNPFNCYLHSSSSEITSVRLVASVLFAFKRGSGVYIDGYTLTYPVFGSNKKDEDGETKFRAALLSQIHDLTGQKPRYAVHEKKYAIYYE